MIGLTSILAEIAKQPRPCEMRGLINLKLSSLSFLSGITVTLNYRIQTYNFLNLNVIYLNRTVCQVPLSFPVSGNRSIIQGTIIESENLEPEETLKGQLYPNPLSIALESSMLHMNTCVWMDTTWFKWEEKEEGSTSVQLTLCYWSC